MPHQIPSEDELIRIIQRTVKKRSRVRLGIGDDAALLKNGTAITTDAYAEGVHFDLSYMTLRQVGERCACGAISDVVAMAAEPEAVFVSLALPRRASCTAPGARGHSIVLNVEEQVRQLYSGIDRVCADTGCEVAGGDIIVADRLLLALTVTGKTRTPKLRSGVRPGDALYVTGYLGSAEAGRMILADEVRSQKSETRSQNAATGKRVANGDWRSPLVRRHLRPIPRLAAMKSLKPWIHGLIDTSDGLATDARHLAEMSRVEIVLEADALPILPATRRFCAGRGSDPLSFVLGAGEDYELLFTSSRRIPSDVRGVKVTRIGSIQHGHGLWIRSAGGIVPVTASGYDHLRNSGDGRTC
jgi:thiamine-monophosphate kinase